MSEPLNMSQIRTLLIEVSWFLYIACSADSAGVKFVTVDLNSSSSWFMALDADSKGYMLAGLSVCMSVLLIYSYTECSCFECCFILLVEASSFYEAVTLVVLDQYLLHCVL